MAYLGTKHWSSVAMADLNRRPQVCKTGQGGIFTIRNRQITQYVDKHPQQYSLADIANLFSGYDCTTPGQMA
jgi:hypothetical protein